MLGARKQCVSCQEIKALEQFHRRSRSADGLQPKCKDCALAYGASWRAKNPHLYRSYSRAQSRAAARLAGRYSDEYEALLAEELAVEREDNR